MGDALASGAMVGFGETFICAFALAVGHSELLAGILGSAPLAVGGLLQLASPALIRLVGSHGRWVLICAALQTLAFAPLVVGAVSGGVSFTVLILAASLYWTAGLASSPAWNTWIGQLAPRRIRPAFFARRTRAYQGMIFCGFVLGGFALQLAGEQSLVLWTFAALFSIAGFSRMVSTWFLSRQSNGRPVEAGEISVSLDLAAKLFRSYGGRLLLFLAAMQVGVQIAGPFFTPFMFGQLHMGYGMFVSVLSVAYVAKMVSLPLWGRVVGRIGPRRVLWMSSLAITPMAGLWVFSQSYAWLLATQVVSGAAWAGYELAFFLLFFESMEERERTAMLTIYNLLNTLAFIGGSLIGAALLVFLGTNMQSYLILFGVSTGVRLLALPLLFWVRPPRVEATELNMRPLSVRPNMASLDAPVVPSIVGGEALQPQE